MRTVDDVLAELQRVVEEGEQGDWAAYALELHAPTGALAVRARLAALLAEADFPQLRVRRRWMDIEADPQVMETAALADAIEERNDDPAEALVALFARKESLARRADSAGYAQLALAAVGLSHAHVTAQLAGAELVARAEARVVDVIDRVERLPAENDVLDLFRSFFAPLLDDVEMRFAPGARVAGMCKALEWPHRLAAVVRPAGTTATAAERAASLSATAHELGHALQWRARAVRGMGFLDFFALPALDSETAADLCERLLFESELGTHMPLPRTVWASERASSVLRQVGRARFELGAYGLALDEPSALPVLWAEVTGEAPACWSREGHGFYTEDAMRRYAYPLAYVRSGEKLAELEPPLTAEMVARVV